MELVDVVNLTPIVETGGVIKLTFNVVGAVSPFIFPFSNESLTEDKIEFIDLENL